MEQIRKTIKRLEKIRTFYVKYAPRSQKGHFLIKEMATIIGKTKTFMRRCAKITAFTRLFTTFRRKNTMNDEVGRGRHPKIWKS